MRELSHTVTPAEAGRTLAALLHQHAGVSHRIAKGIVDAGLAEVDGRPERDPTARLAAGARLVARFDPGHRYQPSYRAPRRTAWFQRTLEDPDFLVVDKRPGVLTVPAGEADGKSLIERLLAAESPAARARGLWVVHRIDRFVSGLVVVARTPEALQHLRGQFAARAVLREYAAICEGAPPEERGEVVSHLKEHPKSLKMMVVAPEEGERAALRYRVVERLQGACLLEVHLETGKRNQIRVQLADIGCPLLGDVAYGRPSPLLPRVALHAARLEFRHPRTGELVACAAALPEDMEAALRRLRAPASPDRAGDRGRPASGKGPGRPTPGKGSKRPARPRGRGRERR